MNYKIRKAEEKDCDLIFNLIKELAIYEEMGDLVVGNSEMIRQTIFAKNPKAFVLLAEIENEVVGFALYFFNFSTFLCKHGIYIEDIYVKENFRGNGIGKAFFKEICKIALSENCGRVEWWCLDWNKPSIDFYLKIGAEAMKDWTVYRLTSEKIKEIVSGEI